MKKLSNSNIAIHFSSIFIFLVILGVPVAADTGQHPSLSQLNAQIEGLTRQLHALQYQINRFGGVNNLFVTNNAKDRSVKDNRIGQGRNKRYSNR